MSEEVKTTEPTEPSASPTAASNTPSVSKTAGKVAILTIGSKILGLVRDQVVAAAYGTSVLSDAYNYAYLFTGNVLILFGGLGGPFHSATVAILQEKKSDPESGKFVTQAAVLTVIVLAIIAVLVCIFAPYLVHHLFWKYAEGNEIRRLEFFKETIKQVRVMSPLIVMTGLVGISYGVLNVFNKIFWPSVSPAIASVAIIAALCVWPDSTSSVPLAVGSLVGAFGQMIAQLPTMFGCGLRFRFSTEISDDLKTYMRMLLPAAFGTSIGQIITYVDSVFCSNYAQEGVFTAYSNANRLIQLPLGVLITAMIVPLLPRFASQAAANNIDELKAEFRRGLSFLWFLAMPLTTIFLVIPRPIVQALFQRHHFTSESTELVTLSVLCMAPMITMYIGRDLITRVFYGFQDSRTPFLVALIAIGIKAALDWYLIVVRNMGIGGVSIATTLITVINFALLSTLLRRKIGSMGYAKLAKPFLVMLLAASSSGAATYGLFNLMTRFLSSQNLLVLLAKIAIASGVGGVLYLLICMLFKLEEPIMLKRQIVSRLARKPSKPTAAA